MSAFQRTCWSCPRWSWLSSAAHSPSGDPLEWHPMSRLRSSEGKCVHLIGCPHGTMILVSTLLTTGPKCLYPRLRHMSKFSTTLRVISMIYSYQTSSSNPYLISSSSIIRVSRPLKQPVYGWDIPTFNLVFANINVSCGRHSA